MLFDTVQYWLFFLAVVVGLAVLGARHGRILLVLASLVFYSFWDPRFVLLLAGSTIFNFYSGILVDANEGRKRKATLAIAIVGNLGVLSFFKYYNFFAASLASLLHVDPTHWALTVILPVGVSFFTFEGIAYNVDVFHRTIRARRSLIDFSLFISFFPHLIAGPIIRPHDFFPQVGPRWGISGVDFRWGMFQVIKGLIKKSVFSDALAIYADAYFKSPSTASVSAFVGIVAFGLQIYFDFAGYTDIARGCARILGYRFPPNFERPYLSLNVSEFWRRWHISLSSWLRDYLYIPLGGNRHGIVRTYVNYLVVMGLGGLWHGASWNFVVWGLYHGLLLSLHRLWVDFAPAGVRQLFNSKPGRGLSWGVTTILVFIGWVPFRAADWFGTILTLQALASPANYAVGDFPKDLLVLACLSGTYCWLDRRRVVEGWIENRLSITSFSILAGMAIWLMSLFMQRNASVPFIYFQF